MQPLHPLHQAQSWIELGLKDQAVIFTMDINGVNTMIILQNPNFLLQLVMEGMKMAMNNYVNHIWMENVLSPLAPAVAPTLFHNMQPLWNFPCHFNSSISATSLTQLPFFTPEEIVDDNPLFFPWVSTPLQVHAT